MRIQEYNKGNCVKIPNTIWSNRLYNVKLTFSIINSSSINYIFIILESQFVNEILISKELLFINIEEILQALLKLLFARREIVSMFFF